MVCPASLQRQWRDEMREKFGLEFRIVDRELLGQLRRARGVGANPFAHFPRLIVSIDWLKGELGMRLLREVLPAHPEIPRRYDVLIVDEVHNCAPAGAGGRYARDTLRTAAVRTLAPHCEHRLFLSATPHNGYDNSFAALLELLALISFEVASTFPIAIFPLCSTTHIELITAVLILPPSMIDCRNRFEAQV